MSNISKVSRLSPDYLSVITTTLTLYLFNCYWVRNTITARLCDSFARVSKLSKNCYFVKDLFKSLQKNDITWPLNQKLFIKQSDVRSCAQVQEHLALVIMSSKVIHVCIPLIQQTCCITLYIHWNRFAFYIMESSVIKSWSMIMLIYEMQPCATGKFLHHHYKCSKSRKWLHAV